MELKDASIEEIDNELVRRRVLDHHENIRTLVNEICTACNNEKIAMITVEKRNVGTSAEAMTYFVHMK